MDQGKKLVFLVLGIAAVLAAWASMFTVKEWERAILFRFGEIVRTDYKPGLHFKIPVIHNVRKFDKRILTIDAKPESFFTGPAFSDRIYDWGIRIE